MIALLASLGISVYFTFQDQTALDASDIAFTNTQREEIQRYFGYEDLLSRYLTLPYDLSMNTNQQGSFVDIGFLYIMFIPLILFAILKKPIQRLMMALLTFIFFVLSIANSYILVDKTKVSAEFASTIFTMPEANWVDRLLAYVYAGAYAVFNIIKPGLERISGEQDYVTYPFIILSFLAILYFAFTNWEKKSMNVRTLILLSISYGFFFLVFSSGIIWYGYLFFVLLMIGMIYYFSTIEDRDDFMSVLLKLSFVIFACIWIAIGMVSRISNITPGTPKQHMGKAIISPDVYLWNTGEIKSKSELLDRTTPGLSATFDEINSDLETKIYKVGTGLTYFIEENHKRVMPDNQLGMFYALIDKYPNQYVISDVLKASGFKYMIIDLNTPSIDNTPEKTLTTKFNALLSYVLSNDSVRLMSTDNIVTVNGQPKYDIEGDELLRKGTFAIYEIN